MCAHVRLNSSHWYHLSVLSIALWIGIGIVAPSAHANPAFFHKLSQAALARTKHQIRYDGSYLSIAYPGGDVPPEIGVCTDVVIRAYRVMGIDLQQKVHEDMKKYFSLYPKKWGLKRTDTNIDHRRVPNLRKFFSRRGKSLPLSANPKDYHEGDIVTWDLGGGVPHIGIVVPWKQTPRVVHNIGAGPKHEAVLFSWKITGHFRYGDKIR